MFSLFFGNCSGTNKKKNNKVIVFVSNGFAL